MQTKSENHFDVAIIGSGLAGATLAAILARHSLKVIMFEAKSHPRFSIGESMILETSEMMRALAELYDVPEIAYFSSENFLSQAGSSHGVKRHFGFMHHQAGQSHNPDHTLQAVIPKEPHGHELHLYRQDTDYFMMMCAVKHGATIQQNTAIKDVDITASDVTLITANDQTISADFVVDAGGFRSVISQKLNLRTQNQQTLSRGLFTHMIDVALVGADSQHQADYDLPFRMHEGTLHHVFEGGWLWVIPFNNHAQSTNPLVSVGLMLDPRVYPQDDTLTPEEEFFQFIDKFPEIKAQFSQAKSVRDWVRAPRIQYGSKQIVGDRWAVLGHAAGFIDPLYSKGLYVSLTSVNILADLLIRVQTEQTYTAHYFAPLEQVTQAYLTTNDQLVAHSYKAFTNPKLWQVYAVQWLLGAYTEYVKLNAIRIDSQGNRAQYLKQLYALRMAGGGFKGFASLTRQVDALMEVVDPKDEVSVTETIEAIRRLYEAIDWMPQPFYALLDGKTHLPKNKLRLSLLNPNAGFMGQGHYRKHFFGNHNLYDLIIAFLREKLRYSPSALKQQHIRRQAT
ncbi:MAG: NAD(P)/FAD-dependent oxidoreductase [Chloroflexota bacterium]